METLTPARPPRSADLDGLRAAAVGCRACPLWERATQTVFGSGPRSARTVMVGEQPGDREDVEGRPFVGPAGRLLNQALEEAGIDPDETFLTNVVKHFKWRARGRRRIHDTPNEREVAACLPWLHAELSLVTPDVLVCLGATAARALVGPDVRVTLDRGRPVESDLAPLVTVTVHPSAVLRAPDRAARRDAFAALVADLAIVKAALHRS